MVATIIPIVLFYLMEANTHNAFTEVRAWAQFFNILIIEFLFLILMGITGRVSVSLQILTFLAAVFGLTNYYVYTFRGSPFVPWDVLSWKTASSVAGNYDFALPARQIIILVAMLALAVAAQFVCRIKVGRKIRLGFLLTGLLCLVFLSKNLQNEEFQDDHSLYRFLFTPVYMWQVNGYMVTFDMDLPYVTVKKPADYSKEYAESILSRYEDDEDIDESIDNEENADGVENNNNNDNTSTSDSTDYPNIVVIMDEAFSDLSVLGDFTASEDPIPFFKSLMNADNCTSGYLNVSVCGGNTANTEFEYLTGNTMRFLPGGSIPYQQYITEDSELFAIPEYLESLGYSTYAMHPYKASGWSRDIVYPVLGFDDIRFIDEMTNLSVIRDYVSDYAAFDNIKQIMEEKDDSPAFIFEVTMQNHGSYSKEADNFTPTITVEGKESNFSLTQYLSLLKETDNALSDLIQYFSEQDEKTIVVFFGDHQPNNSVAKSILQLNGMDPSSLTEEEQELRYIVPYVIWANYDIDEEKDADTSVNFLGMETLRTAGVPLAPYQKLLEELEEYYPIISASKLVCEEESELISDYEKVQYYMLFDR